MKEKDAQVKCDEHQMVLFVEKEDGSYGAVQTGSYMVSNFVDDFWDKRKKLEQDCLQRLQRGEMSPVAYFLTLREIAPADLAARVGIATAQVKKHMQPRLFQKMRIETAARYAEVFGIALAELFQTPSVGGGAALEGGADKAPVPGPQTLDVRNKQ